MTDENNQDYHRRRAREEQERAEQSPSIQAQARHRVLSSLHRERADAATPRLSVVASA